MASGLLEDRIDGASRILLNVAGSASLTLGDVTQAADTLRAVADRDSNITFGASFEPKLGDEVVVTVIAAGLRSAKRAAAAPKRVSTPAVAVVATPAPKRDRTAKARAKVVAPAAAAAVSAASPDAAVAEAAGPALPDVAAPAAPRADARPRPRRATPANARPRRAAPRPATSSRPPRGARARGSSKPAPPPAVTLSGAPEHESFDLPSFLRSRSTGPGDNSGR
jgi:FtsZ family protein